MDKYEDLAMFDGSVIVERTKDEISARCDKEEMNLLALNLANDVAAGKKQWTRRELTMQELHWILCRVRGIPMCRD